MEPKKEKAPRTPAKYSVAPIVASYTALLFAFITLSISFQTYTSCKTSPDCKGEWEWYFASIPATLVAVAFAGLVIGAIIKFFRKRAATTKKATHKYRTYAIIAILILTPILLFASYLIISFILQFLLFCGILHIIPG